MSSSALRGAIFITLEEKDDRRSKSYKVRSMSPKMSTWPCWPWWCAPPSRCEAAARCVTEQPVGKAGNPARLSRSKRTLVEKGGRSEFSSTSVVVVGVGDAAAAAAANNLVALDTGCRVWMMGSGSVSGSSSSTVCSAGWCSGCSS